MISALLVLAALAQEPTSWSTDLEGASARAAQDDRPLLLVFR